MGIICDSYVETTRIEMASAGSIGQVDAIRPLFDFVLLSL